MAGADCNLCREPCAVGSLLCEQAVATVLRRGHEALRLLLEAYNYAREVQRDVWDFAVEIDPLRQAGCTNSEFRWLVCKGYVDHALESTLAGEESRSFQRQQHPASLTFGRRTCFVLTAAGSGFSEIALGEPAVGTPADPKRCERREPEATSEWKPKWDRERQELRLGEIVVKQFKVPAANQERILAAFEEEGWPVRIDDPLPPASDQDSKRRLHDTINSLNRNQKRNLVRFLGDGSGLGIRWELVEPRTR